MRCKTRLEHYPKLKKLLKKGQQNCYSFETKDVRGYLRLHPLRSLESHSARKLRPALTLIENVASPLLRFPPTPLPLTFSYTRARAHAAHTCDHKSTHVHAHTSSTTPGASPLVGYPWHPCRRLLRSAEWPKVGGSLLAAYAINSKACCFYWMDLARPPYPASPYPPLLYWLLRRGWVGARTCGVPFYRPGQLYYCVHS